MSTSGPITNYYVDSLINHENEDVLSTRFSSAGPLSSGPRSTTLVPECGDYPSCSFAPKPPVFTTTWAPVHSQSSVVYHPYSHQPHLGTDSRYVRSWLEPIPGAVSFPGYAANSRHYGLKPDAFQEHRTGDCLTTSGRTFSDYLYCSPADIREKTQQTNPSPETEIVSSAKEKDEKPELDPSKLNLFSFIMGSCRSASVCLSFMEFCLWLPNSQYISLIPVCCKLNHHIITYRVVSSLVVLEPFMTRWRVRLSKKQNAPHPVPALALLNYFMLMSIAMTVAISYAQPIFYIYFIKGSHHHFMYLSV